jgi:hypothetical protein
LFGFFLYYDVYFPISKKLILRGARKAAEKILPGEGINAMTRGLLRFKKYIFLCMAIVACVASAASRAASGNSIASDQNCRQARAMRIIGSNRTFPPTLSIAHFFSLFNAQDKCLLKNRTLLQ